jgi:hypothetical protein
MMTKKQYYCFVGLLLIILLFLPSCSKKEIIRNPLQPKTNNPISLEAGEEVIDTYIKEVKEKEEINRIDLVAKNKKAPFYYDLLLIVDGVRYSLDSEMKGYSPKLLLADLDNDGFPDFYITIKSGNTDNSIFFGLYHFQKREFKSLLPETFNKGIIPLQISWFSENILQIQSNEYQINTKKTLSFQDKSFLFSKIGLTGYQNLILVDIDKDGQSELMTEQSIWLQYPHQSFFRFLTTLKYSHNQWILLEYRFIPIRLD